MIGWQHRELELCQMWDWWWNTNNNISFHSRLFPRKTNEKLFQKVQKEPYLGPFWALFTQIGQKWIFLEKRAMSVFRYSNYLSSCQKSEKNYWAISEENTKLRDRQTDDVDFIRPYIGKFFGIICLIHTQNCSKLNLSPSP